MEPAKLKQVLTENRSAVMVNNSDLIAGKLNGRYYLLIVGAMLGTVLEISREDYEKIKTLSQF